MSKSLYTFSNVEDQSVAMGKVFNGAEGDKCIITDPGYINDQSKITCKQRQDNNLGFHKIFFHCVPSISNLPFIKRGYRQARLTDDNNLVKYE